MQERQLRSVSIIWLLAAVMCWLLVLCGCKTSRHIVKERTNYDSTATVKVDSSGMKADNTIRVIEKEEGSSKVTEITFDTSGSAYYDFGKSGTPMDYYEYLVDKNGSKAIYFKNVKAVKITETVKTKTKDSTAIHNTDTASKQIEKKDAVHQDAVTTTKDVKKSGGGKAMVTLLVVAAIVFCLWWFVLRKKRSN